MFLFSNGIKSLNTSHLTTRPTVDGCDELEAQIIRSRRTRTTQDVLSSVYSHSASPRHPRIRHRHWPWFVHGSSTNVWCAYILRVRWCLTRVIFALCVPRGAWYQLPPSRLSANIDIDWIAKNTPTRRISVFSGLVLGPSCIMQYAPAP